ncbi:minor capsid protein [Acinetobacter johnsonii]|nr:minor capsid protein [Acinetobacter johnsonii]
MQPVTFLEALQYAHSKKVVLPDEFYSMDLKTRQMATTVSFLSSLEQAESVIKSLNKTLASGGTFNDFQKLVAESEIVLPKHYLDNVFRTNIQSAYGHGRWQQQQRNKDKRQYLMYSAINDSRVRPAHLALNRIVLPIDHPFWLTHYPPLGFRCFLPETKIDGASHGAIKRFYSGKIVKLVTKSGRELRVTANHPILTSRGWVIAELIKQGDNLIAYDRPVESLNANGLTRKVYNDEFVPTAENLFKTFVGHALTIGKASSFKLNSNLFASDSEIHIDVIDDGLSIKIDSNDGKGVEQRMFVIRNDGTCFETIKACGTPDSGCVVADIVLSQDAINITGRGVEGSSDFTLADILRLIEIEDSKLQLSIGVPTGIPGSRALTLNSTWSLFDGLPLDRFGLASSSQDNTLFEELSSNGLSDDSGLFGYLINTHASHVATDPVINVIEDSYSGHVYDFQSDSGLLSADGIITHNCRCTVIALTEKQAIKYGITPDDKLPQVAEALDWSSHPLQFGEFEALVDQKISKSLLDKEYLLEQKEAIKAEWTASKKLTSLLAPMDDKSRDLFNTVANTVIPLDPSIRPSAIKTFLDYVQGNDAAMTNYLNATVSSKADDVLKQWLRQDMQALNAVASNSAAIVTGGVTLQHVFAYEVGQTIQFNSPLLLAENATDVVLQIENAKGLGIDLNELNAGQGVLMPMGLSFEVVSIETLNGKMIYTLKALVN